MEVTFESFRPVNIRLENEAEIKAMIRMCNRYLEKGEYDHSLAKAIKLELTKEDSD
jgi:hypothetical protein